MEYLYSALLLHSTGQTIDAGNIEKVLKAAGTKADAARVKMLVSSLDGVDIEDAIANAAAAPVAAAAPSGGGGGGAAAPAAAEEEEEEEDEDDEEESMAGLGALFG